jgi:type IV pilus assembly protein PilA
MFCSSCGAEARAGAQVCARCGNTLTPLVRDDAPASEGELLEAAIGPNNTHYYLERFHGFATSGRYTSWNWPAFFVPTLWMLYRKMWLHAALCFFVLPVVVLAVCGALFLALPRVPAAVASGVLAVLATFVLVPLYANALYYHAVRDKVRIATRPGWGRDKQLRYLASAGGTSLVGIVVAAVCAFGFLPLAGIVAAIAIPAYQDITLRAQVSEGLALAAEPRAAIEEYVIANGALPLDRAAVGLLAAPTATSGSYVSSVDVRDGRIEVVYGNGANRLLAGRTLALTPYGVQNGEAWQVVWRCGFGDVPASATHELTEYYAGDLEPQWLPSACRPSGRR